MAEENTVKENPEEISMEKIAGDFVSSLQELLLCYRLGFIDSKSEIQSNNFLLDTEQKEKTFVKAYRKIQKRIPFEQIPETYFQKAGELILSNTKIAFSDEDEQAFIINKFNQLIQNTQPWYKYNPDHPSIPQMFAAFKLPTNPIAYTFYYTTAYLGAMFLYFGMKDSPLATTILSSLTLGVIAYFVNGVNAEVKEVQAPIHQILSKGLES